MNVSIVSTQTPTPPKSDVSSSSAVASSSSSDAWTLVDKPLVILTVPVPALSFKLSDPLPLDFSSSVVFPDPLAASAVVGALSSRSGISELTIRAEMSIAVTVLWIKWFKHLPVRRDFQVKDLTNSLEDLASGLPKPILERDLSK